MSSIAFFDFDKTLLAVNSAWLWLRREVRLGHLTRWQLMRGGFWLARYHLGSSSLDATMKQVIATLAGSSQSEVRARTQDFYTTELRSLYRPGALQAVEHHRALGDCLVLLTSSSIYLVELAAEQLGLDDILCNRFEVDGEGRHTGRPVGDICFGEGKLVHAAAYAKAHGIPLERCTFYTDSYSDLPVMQAVGNAVAVNPDQRLRREALRRGWRIVDWSQPVAQ